jgi:hypothetical protein
VKGKPMHFIPAWVYKYKFYKYKYYEKIDLYI